MAVLVKAIPSELSRIVKSEHYWFENHCLTFDEAHREIRPYPCWPYQMEFIEELQSGGNILVEKSGAMMITWAVSLHMLYCVQYMADWTGFAVSRKESEVDDGGINATVHSIWGKMLFSWKQQDPLIRIPLLFSHLKISNMLEDMNSYVTGESANTSAGRGRSATFKWADEFAFIPNSEDVHSAMVGRDFQTLLYTSTSNLSGNAFHRLRTDPQSGFRILTYLWYLRPDRNQDWYDAKKATMRAVDAAKELDCTYDPVISENVYSRYSPSIHTRKPVDMPEDYDRVILVFDEGFAYPGAMYVMAKRQNQLLILDEYYQAGIHVLLSEKQRASVHEKDWVALAEEFVKAWPGIDTIVVGSESRTAADTFSDKLRIVTILASQDRAERIKLVDRLMIGTQDGVSRLLISQACDNLLGEIPNYKWKKQPRETPQDGNDHGVDCMATGAEYLFPEESGRERIEPAGDWCADLGGGGGSALPWEGELEPW